MAGQQGHRGGTFADGTDFETWGTGPKVLVYLPGGPGSSIPTGLGGWMSRRWFRPFVDAGYSVWVLTRRRGMPGGHTVADMADDVARVITTELGGRVDLVVGVSFGGMIAQHLAARHGDLLGHVAVVVAAAEVCDWGKDVDARLAEAVARGDRVGAGMTFAEYVAPGDRRRWLRRLVGPWIGRSLLSGRHYPPADLVVEVEAELGCDARSALPGIAVPVLLVCGDRDQFFTSDVVEETARLVPRSTLVWHEGKGHMAVASSRQVPKEVLEFVGAG